jgi:cardiolipin synthase
VTLPIWVVLLHASVTLVLVVVIWSMKRRRSPDYQVKADAPAAELIRSIAGLTHSHVSEGNAAQIVENGEFFERLLADIRAAEASVHFETFLWKEGKIGSAMARTLAERAAAGVEVRVLLDANGSRRIGDATIEALRQSGATVAWYHAGKLRNVARLNSRDHRKLAIIDGRIAYAGGHCIVDSWLGDADDREHFRDLSVRLRGPVVLDLQSTFAENWVATTGELFVGDTFPRPEAVGSTLAHIARLAPRDSASDVKVLHYLLIACARKHIRIQNPYFVPDPTAIDLMIAAVQRGVDVRVMSPAAAASDMPIVQHAAHRNFLRLLRGGVRIYEYQKTLLHQKVMSVDGSWACIGSSNFDDRSFEINQEVTIGLCDADLAARFDAIFEKDLEDCEELEAESWSRRSLRHRALDNLLYLFNEQI